jgi:hypothetical protein
MIVYNYAKGELFHPPDSVLLSRIEENRGVSKFHNGEPLVD